MSEEVDHVEPGLLREATDRLRDLLDVRFAAAGAVSPTVVALGDTDVRRPDRDPWADRRPAATVHVSSRAVLLGPWPRGGAGCGYCLAIRWQRLRERYERDVLETGTGLRAGGRWPVVTAYLADAVFAAHAAREAEFERGGVPGGATTEVTGVDITTLQVSTVDLLAAPGCPACKYALRSRPLPVPGSRPKSDPGRYRTRAPGGYALPERALANPVCGAIGPAARIDLTCPTNAPVSGGITTRVSTDGLVDVSWSGHADSYADSRTLALFEGLERYAGTHPRRTPDVVDSLANLGERALDPRNCGLYEPARYERDDRLRRFAADRRIPWVPGYSLRDEREILVPSRLPYYGSGTPEENFVYGSSSGCASGGCLEEAVLFGLFELIERDAFLHGWYGGTPLTAIDPATIDDPVVRQWLDRAALVGYDVRVFDNRVDLAVPAVTAVAVRRDGGLGTLCFAAGANLDPVAAVRAAVCEVVTYLPTLAPRTERRLGELTAMADDFGKVRVLADHAALFGLPEMTRHARRYLEPAPARSFDEVFGAWAADRPRTHDLLDDIAHCRDELVAAGYDVIVVDQTAPEQERMGLVSVATIVPGLLPIDFGWDLQRALRMPRLFTAQRRAGLRATDLTDADVHRVPHPFP